MTVALNREELVALVADVLDLSPDVVTDDAHFITDLGIDSLLALELAVALERQYQIKIESSEIVDVESLRDVIALLERKLTIAV
ncbi:acyl carrier protein [Micromonospora sp. M12]